LLFAKVSEDLDGFLSYQFCLDSKEWLF